MDAADDAHGTAFGVRLLPRDDLVARLRHTQTAVIIEAGAGYGKSVLIDQCVAEHGGSSLVIRLAEGGPFDRHDIAGLIATAGGRNGLHPVEALSVDAEPAETAEALSFLDQSLVSVDGASRMTDDAADWLATVIRLAPTVRFIVSGRLVPTRLRALEARGAAALISPTQLSFNDSETQALAEAELGDDATDVWRLVQGVTHGLPALTALVLRRLALSDDPKDAARQLMHTTAPVSELIGLHLDGLSLENRARAAQLARLPSFDVRMADALGGQHFLTRLHHEGLPLTRRADGWWQIPSPIADHLVAAHAADIEAILTVTPLLVAGGLALPATQMLIDLGRPDDAADLIGELSNAQLDALDARTAIRTIEQLGSVLDRRPRCLLHLARVHYTAMHNQQHRLTLDRAVVASESDGDEATRRDTLLEKLFFEVLASSEPSVDREQRLAELAVGVDPNSTTAARIHEIRGGLLSDLPNLSSFDDAAFHFRAAADLFDRHRETTMAMAARRGLVSRILRHLGRYSEANHLLREILASPTTKGYDRYFTAVWHFRLLALAGRCAAAEAVAEEVEPTIRLIGNRWLLGFLEWGRVACAARSGDAERTMAHVRLVEDYLAEMIASPWGYEVLAELAQAAAIVGRHDEAVDLLSRAERDEHFDAGKRRVTAATMAALADPSPAAIERLERLTDEADLAPYHRPDLLITIAVTHARLGDTAAAAHWLALARAAADAMDQQGVLNDYLVGLIESDHAPKARSTVIRLFGGFSVEHGGDVVATIEGRPTTLVKLIALHEGSLHVDVAIDRFWPDADPELGRRRLRNVLRRARSHYGPFVERRGDLLVFEGDVEVDVATVDRLARSAIQDQDVAAASRALDLVGGTILPEDRFDLEAEQARDHLRHRFLALADMALDEQLNGPTIDPNRVAELLRRVTIIDTFSTELHERAFMALVSRGAPTQARSVLEDLVRAQTELGLDPDPSLQDRLDDLQKW